MLAGLRKGRISTTAGLDNRTQKLCSQGRFRHLQSHTTPLGGREGQPPTATLANHLCGKDTQKGLLMSTSVSFSSDGPPETVLPAGPQATLDSLESAGSDPERVAIVVAANPRLLAGWAQLGDLAAKRTNGPTGEIEAYAYYRIGYHRGLDALRQNGWKGAGLVRWAHETNRGFLRCLDGLQRMAEAIGETEEQERCGQFLRQLDPEWPPEEPTA